LINLSGKMGSRTGRTVVRVEASIASTVALVARAEAQAAIAAILEATAAIRLAATPTVEVRVPRTEKSIRMKSSNQASTKHPV